MLKHRCALLRYEGHHFEGTAFGWSSHTKSASQYVHTVSISWSVLMRIGDGRSWCFDATNSCFVFPFFPYIMDNAGSRTDVQGGMLHPGTACSGPNRAASRKIQGLQAQCKCYTAKSVATSWNFRSSGASFYVLWCSVVAPRIVPQLFTSITYLPLLDLDQFRCKPSCKSVWTAVASTLETLWMWMVSAWIWGRSWGECYFSVFVDAICSVMSLWLMQRCDDFCTEQGAS